MSELAKALHAFQADAPKLPMDATNPHFRSKFLSLGKLTDIVVPALNAHGVVVMQLPTVIDGKPALRTRLVHAESGDAVEDAMLLMSDKDTPQGQGSAITYARRYALMAALGLVADEDDDGNSSSGAGSSSGEKTTGTDGAEAGSTPAPDTPFKKPAGPRGGKNGVTEKLRAELLELVTQLGASDSLASVHAHADEGDDAWLRRQIKTAKKAIADRQLAEIPF